MTNTTPLERVRNEPQTPGREFALGHLRSVLASDELRGSPRLCELLSYLVVETLDGRGDRIKGFTIAQEVFHRTDPEDAQTSTIVSVEARRLRRKLADYYADAGKHETWQIQIPKGSYVPVFELRSADTEPSGLTGSKGRNAKAVDKSKGFSRHQGLAALLLAAIVLLTIGFWIADNNWNHQTAGQKPLLVVMPFNNLTKEPSLDAYATGLSEDITSALAPISELEIIAHSSVLLFAQNNGALEDVSSTFGATHAVYGTLRGKDPNYRVGVELVEIQTGKLIWANRFEKDLSAPIKTQIEIADSVARALPVTLSQRKLSALEKKYQPSPDTLALFDQAMALANPPSDPQRLNLARSAFEQVIRADSNFPGGFAGLAYIEAFTGVFLANENTPEVSKNARNLANRALDIDPTNALALNALAFSDLISGDFEGAINVSGEAVKLNPNDPYALAYHGFLRAVNGDPDEGLPYVERALALDPLEPRTPYLNILGTIKFQAGDYQGAIEAFLENQKRSGPNGPGSRATLAAAYLAKNEQGAAREVYRTLPRDYIYGRWLDWRLLVYRTREDAEKGPELLAQFERPKSQ